MPRGIYPRAIYNGKILLCSKCKQEKSVKLFLKFPRCTQRKYTSWCRQCIENLNRIWQSKNRKYINLFSKVWRKKHPDYLKKYRKKHYKQIKNYNKKYMKLYNYKRRLLNKNAGELSLQTLQLVYEDNIKKYGTLTCYLCLNPIPFGKDNLEHKIPLSRGGTNEYNNLAIACKSCNCSKRNKSEEEYRKYVIKS